MRKKHQKAICIAALALIASEALIIAGVVDQQHSQATEVIEKPPLTSSYSKVEEPQYETKRYYSLELPQNFPVHSEELQDFVRKGLKNKGLPEDLEPYIYAMMYVESRYNPDATSSTSDLGIMQINAKYFKSFNKDPKANPFDVFDSITAGINALHEWKTVCENRGLISKRHYINCYNKGYNYFKKFNNSYYLKVENYAKELTTYEVSYIPGNTTK